MKIYGRSMLDRERKPIPIDFDELVFDLGNNEEIIVSIYRARKHGEVEVRANNSMLQVEPHAANMVYIGVSDRRGRSL